MQCINVIEIIKLISGTTAADEILSTKQSASKRKQYSNWIRTHTRTLEQNFNMWKLHYDMMTPIYLSEQPAKGRITKTLGRL